jgi:hypothetical protein
MVYGNLPEAHEAVKQETLLTIGTAFRVRTHWETAEQIHQYLVTALHPMIGSESTGKMVAEANGIIADLKAVIADLNNVSERYEALENVMEQYRLT